MDEPQDMPEDMQARHGRILAELAEMGLEVAREMKAQVLGEALGETPGAETAGLRQGAAAQFARVARCVRQCLALESKLRTDDRRERMECEAILDREAARRIRRRKTHVRMWMQRAVAEAYDPENDDDADTVRMHLEDLEERLHDDLLDESFADTPIEDVIATLRRQIGLPDPNGDEAWDDDDPEDEEGPEPSIIEGEAREVSPPELHSEPEPPCDDGEPEAGWGDPEPPPPQPPSPEPPSPEPPSPSSAPSSRGTRWDIPPHDPPPPVSPPSPDPFANSPRRIVPDHPFNSS
ncbi:hypothetical protein [Phenylobacterium sp.]|uniref:hypothetical protein n=1 Tax=Phenylobacterium sp. TaxID=1871053 RepID=UPI00301BC68B